MENPTKAKTSKALTVRKDTQSQMLDVPREEETKFKTETYRIMTMNCLKEQGKGTEDRRRDEIISNIKRFPASVIFCQQVPKCFKKEVVEKYGECNDDYSYEFVPKDVDSKTHKMVVMWRTTDFESEEVKQIGERLKEKKSDVDVTERCAMVKLTRPPKTRKESFLAVSWYWPPNVGDKVTKEKVFDDLIRFLRVVCENEKLSSFIIGGGFNSVNTKKLVHGPNYGVKISLTEEQCGPHLFRYRDAFISFSVSSDKLPMTGDIQVSSVRQLELENKSDEKEPVLSHVPVVGDLKLEQDREPSPSSSQSFSAIHDDHVTKKEFEELVSNILVRKSFKSIYEKVDRLTAEVAEIKLAMKRPDTAQPKELHSQTTRTEDSDLEQESTSEKKKKGKKEKN